MNKKTLAVVALVAVTTTTLSGCGGSVWKSSEARLTKEIPLADSSRPEFEQYRCSNYLDALNEFNNTKEDMKKAKVMVVTNSKAFLYKTSWGYSDEADASALVLDPNCQPEK